MPVEQVLDRRQLGKLVTHAPRALGVLIEHTLGHQRHAGPGADAPDNRAVTGQTDNRQRLPLAQQPMFQRRPIRTTLGPHKDGLVMQIRHVTHWPQRCRGNQQQVFAVHRRALEVRALDIHRDDRTVKPMIERVIQQLAPGARGQFQRHLREALVEFGQQSRQATGGRGLDGADAQRPGGLGRGVHRPFRLRGQRQDFRGVGQKGLTRRTDAQPAPLAQKQRDTQLRLQRLDPRRDVRRHAMQHVCRTGDAAHFGNGLEHANLCQLHTSPKVNG